VINELPPLPTRLLLSEAQRRAARNGVFDLPGYGPVSYRGSNPLGEPRVALVEDYHGQGSFDLPARAALTLADLIAARFAPNGDPRP
jgi:hypothetical protein